MPLLPHFCKNCSIACSPMTLRILQWAKRLQHFKTWRNFEEENHCRSKTWSTKVDKKWRKYIWLQWLQYAGQIGDFFQLPRRHKWKNEIKKRLKSPLNSLGKILSLRWRFCNDFKTIAHVIWTGGWFRQWSGKIGSIAYLLNLRCINIALEMEHKRAFFAVNFKSKLTWRISNALLITF